MPDRDFWAPVLGVLLLVDMAALVVGLLVKHERYMGQAMVVIGVINALATIPVAVDGDIGRAGLTVVVGVGLVFVGIQRIRSGPKRVT